MREKVVCPQGHYYDKSKYSSCPHCAEGMEAGKAEHVWSTTKETRQVENHTVSKSKTGMSIFRKKDKTVQEESKRVSKEVPKVDPLTCALNDANKTERLEQVHTENGSAQVGESSVVMTSVILKESKNDCVQPDLNVMSVAKVNLDEGKTVGYFHTGGKEEPPVGYLICTAGEDYGKGFALKSGNNNLGRSAAMDIIIMDPKVSRDKHIAVIYEPHKRDFYVKPSENGALSYCNGEILLSAQKIYSHDILEIGDTKLMLIPVCSEKFSWEE